MEDHKIYKPYLQPMPGFVQIPSTAIDFPRYDVYPFPFPTYDPGGIHPKYYTRDYLFHILQNYVVHEELSVDTHHIIPLDFTKYSMGNLCGHYGIRLEMLKQQPLFFFHHWGRHPSKWTIDKTQNTSMDNVTHSYWERTNIRQEHHMGCITTYYLSEQTVNEGIAGDSWTDFAIDEFELHNRFDPEFIPTPIMVRVDCLLLLFYFTLNEKFKNLTV